MQDKLRKQKILNTKNRKKKILYAHTYLRIEFRPEYFKCRVNLRMFLFVCVLFKSRGAKRKKNKKKKTNKKSEHHHSFYFMFSWFGLNFDFFSFFYFFFFFAICIIKAKIIPKKPPTRSHFFFSFLSLAINNYIV